jgi:perosamine synthetase
MQALLERGIATRRGIMCSHREPAYQVQPWRSSGSLLHSEQAQDRGLLLPLFPHLNEEELEHIVSSLRQVVTCEWVA